mmetsp:Transcript_7536/g.11090  ORF Transcript_7536/g.11090 Transcript_7536/m.11090 type:complete len:292 (+) Transcript_7536:42-917(+)
MDPKYIGLCALLLGDQKASEALGIRLEEAKAFKALVDYEGLPCLETLKSTIVELCKQTSHQYTSQQLKIPRRVLEVLCPESLRKPEPSKQKPVDKPVQKPVEQPQPPKPTIPEVPVQSQTTSGLDKEKLFGDLKTRVKVMYEQKVKPKYIQALFEFPNLAIVHNLGNKSPDENSEEFTRTKDYYTKQDAEDILLRVGKVSMKSLSKEYCLSTNTLKLWKTNYKNKRPLNSGRDLESDEESDAFSKFEGIEAYFLTKDLEKAKEITLKDSKLIKDWVHNFCAKVDSKGAKNK